MGDAAGVIPIHQSGIAARLMRVLFEPYRDATHVAIWSLTL